jgi:hypothetical protein
MGVIIREIPPESIQKLIDDDLKYYNTLLRDNQTKELCSYQTRPIPMSFLTPRTAIR